VWGFSECLYLLFWLFTFSFNVNFVSWKKCVKNKKILRLAIFLTTCNSDLLLSSPDGQVVMWLISYGCTFKRFVAFWAKDLDMHVLLKHDTHLLFLSSTEPLMVNFSSVLNNAVMCGTAKAYFLEWVLVWVSLFADSYFACPHFNLSYHRDGHKINPLVPNVRYTCHALWHSKCRTSGIDDGCLMAFMHLLLNSGLLPIKPGV